MAVHIHPVSIPPRFYKPIGQIVAGWNLTEALISSLIWHYHKIKQPPVGRLFTYRASATEKLHMLKVTANMKVHDPELRSRLLYFHTQADRARQDRNGIAHGWWGRMPNERHIWKVFHCHKSDHNFLLRRETKTLKDLTELAAKVLKLNRAIKKFMVENRIPPP